MLAHLAQELVLGGVSLVGMVQDDDTLGPCDMALRLLPGGVRVALSQPLGKGSSGCKLDPGALEQAVGWVERQLEAGADGADPASLMILNKFGRQEAAGRGCRGLIGWALANGLPVLLSVPLETRSEFAQFTCGMAEEVAAEPAALRDWLTRAGIG